MKFEKPFFIICFVCIMQTITIIYLTSGISTLEASIDSSKPVQEISFQEPIKHNQQVSNKNLSTNQNKADLDKNYFSLQANNNEQLREIMRQELSRFFPEKNKKSNTQSQASLASNSEHLNIVNEKMALFRSTGSLNNRDMEDFYLHISRLAPQDRTQALRILSQEINSGNLKLSN